MTLSDVFRIAAAILTSLGGGVVIVFAFSNWLGKVWANRLAERDRLNVERELEELRSELHQQRDEELDVVLRRREIYRRLIIAMRIFVDGAETSSDDQREFYKAYDESFLWASDEVLIAINAYLEVNIRHGRQLSSTSAQQAHRQAFQECVRAMRRDAGFEHSEAEYKFVSFKPHPKID